MAIQVVAEVHGREPMQRNVTRTAGKERPVAFERQRSDVDANTAMLVPDSRARYGALPKQVVTALAPDPRAACLGQDSPAARERRRARRHSEMLARDHVEACER